MDENEYLLGLGLCRGIGNVKLTEMVKVFGSAKKVWENWGDGISNWNEKLNLTVKNHIKNFNIVKYIEDLKLNSINYVSVMSSEFPIKLTELESIPMGLYYKGNWSQINENLLAVVGTRNITDYGKIVTKQLVSGMVDSGLGIVSGLMYGVDEAAHKIAWEKKFVNVGVWAGGLDGLMQSARSVCARNVLESGGLVISEYGLGVEPTPATFPARNRIVAGLSIGVLVIEGSDGSGTLITAGFGAQLGKPIFAVPGPITSKQSQATVSLIKQGAIPVSSVDDILEELPMVKRSNSKNKINVSELSADERELVEKLSKRDFSVDELSRVLNWNVGRVTGGLTLLEIKGLVLRIGLNWSIINI